MALAQRPFLLPTNVVQQEKRTNNRCGKIKGVGIHGVMPQIGPKYGIAAPLTGASGSGATNPPREAHSGQHCHSSGLVNMLNEQSARYTDSGVSVTQ